MKNKIYAAFFSIAFCAALTAGNEPLVKSGVSFTPNKGQVTDQYRQARPDVLFGGQAGAMVFHLRNDGVSYQLSKTSYKPKIEKKEALQAKKKPAVVDHVVIQRLDIKWIGANKNAKIVTANPTAGYNNYYTTGIKEGITQVPSYSSVRYQELYPLIDLHYYDHAGELEYDFIVSPGADYKKINLQINGADKIVLNKNGDVVFSTPLGDLSEGAPKVYQGGKQLSAKWMITGNILSFDISNYDPTKIMIIDPVSRIWGTYYGGSGDDIIFYTSHNSANDVIAVGATESTGSSVIATSGAYQTTMGGVVDAFIVKFNSAGVRQWATYFGGAGFEIANCSADDGSGNIYVTGSTDGASGSAVSTLGSHQPAFGGGNEDAFLSKFSASGVLIWSTYYGGSGDEGSTTCAADASGNAYIAGYSDTGSGTDVATVGSHQPTFGGSIDGFVAKFNAAGVRQWGTYYGGTTDDIITFCATDPSGNVICVGGTDLNTGTTIASSGAFQPTIAGNFDGFIVKFNSAGTRQWGTYYGGNFDDQLYMVGCDLSGNIFVVGDTESSTGLSTAGSHQPLYSNNGDAYVAMFDGTGNRLWGSYYGGTAYDDSYACAVDANGDVYLSGSTETPSGSAIATPGSHQSIFGGGTGGDGYIVKFNSTGKRMWGSYYGGNDDEVAYCSVDGAGNSYVCGYTGSGNGTSIASAGSHQSTLGGGFEGYIAKFGGCTAPAIPTGTSNPANLNFCSNLPATITMTSSGTSEWFTTQSGGNPIYSGTLYTVPTLTPGTFTLYVGAWECTVSPGRNLVVYTVQISPSVTLSSTKSTLCKGETATLTASGAVTYTWASIGSSVSIVVTPTANSSYTAIGTGTNGCYAKSAITQSVTDCLGLTETMLIKTKFYPNPSSGNIFIQSQSDLELSIFNSLGQQVGNWQLLSGASEIKLEVPAGVYFLKMNSGEGERTEKIIIER